MKIKLNQNNIFNSSSTEIEDTPVWRSEWSSNYPDNMTDNWARELGILEDDNDGLPERRFY